MDDNSPILIHVGYYKTGTTWLQKHVFGIGTRGFTPLSRGFESAPKKASKYLSSYFYRDRRGGQLPSFARDVSEVRAFAEQFDLPQGSAGVISSERLLGYFFSNGDDAPSILERIKLAFPNAKILITTRRQHEMILSCYLQYLKRGGTMSLETLLSSKHDDKLSLFSRTYFEYHHAVRAYANAFGRENVLVLPYELFIEDGARYVSAIYHHAGIDPAAFLADLHFSKRENALQKTGPHLLMRHASPLFYTSSLNAHARSLPYGIRKAVHRVIYKSLSRVTSDASERRTKERLAAVCETYVPQGSFEVSNRILQDYTSIDLSKFGYYTSPDR
jgi:hypothetical protein